MRCGVAADEARAWSALLIVLMLEALSTEAFAQSPVCHPIRRGESATQAARRVTGNGQNAYRDWFQIMNPSLEVRSQVAIQPYSARLAGVRHRTSDPEAVFERKSRRRAATLPTYPKFPTAPVCLRRPSRADAGDRPQPGTFDVIRTLGGIDLTMLWLCAAMVVPWFGWRIVDDYLTRRETASIVVRSFVQRFVDEFERPLVRCDVGERPMRSDLRFGARRGRFDILLAPGEGRRYPNLSDHKKNVEYDVARVMRVLGDGSFVSRAPYTKAGWIVLPFQFTAEPKQSGVSCISSL